jgi:DNA polymerase II large subunit
MTSIKYLTEGLANADYYRDNQITSQLYKGNLAVTLGLDKTLITTENFTSLYGNHNPITSE